MNPPPPFTDTWTRRDFVRATAAAAAGGPLLAGAVPSSAAAATRPRWPGYDDALVVDFLGSPGYFNYPGNPPLDDVMVRNALDSGITAMNVTVSGGDFASTARRIGEWMANLDRYPEAFRQARTVADVRSAKAAGQMGIVLGFQDTTPLDGDLANLDVWHDYGVGVIQLTYNVRNLVGDGCLEPANAGLSRYGHAVVERMDELRILVDLSHCGKRTTADGIRASSRPVAITHSGCNAVARHPRSKDDEDLRAMAEGGGVVGIYLMPFLSPGRAARLDDVVAHIEHALNVCGEDHVGIGSDLSTTPIPDSDEYWTAHRQFVSGRIARGVAAPNEDPDILFNVVDINEPRRLERIADALAAKGHPDRVVGKVIGGNWVRVLEEVWGE
ncbi:MAG: membrane dipeptidase [Longimicrobiales bacterium]